jgi:Tfp pilus assembly protein PilN
MRPVNLIPPEQRRGQSGPSKTGATPYLVLVALGLAVAAVAAVVLTGNQINDRESEIASLEVREVAARQRAEALRPYAEFASLSQTREATVKSLAQSRFDWERVLRELALVIPSDVWLIEASGSVSPGAEGESSSDSTTRGEIAGPALELTGCGASHEAVARFAAALEDIDGVTRVGVDSSQRPDAGPTGPPSGVGADGSDCRTRDFISKFEIVAAFDEVAAPALSLPPIAPTTPDSSEIADAEATEQEARDATADQVGKARDAASVVSGEAR